MYYLKELLKVNCEWQQHLQFFLDVQCPGIFYHGAIRESPLQCLVHKV